MKKIEELIDQALRNEPSFKLRGDFRDRVLKAIRRKEKMSQRKLYVLMALGIVVMFGFGLAILAYFQNLEALSTFKNIVPMAVMIGGVVALVQYLDNKLVKKKMFNQQLS